VRGWRGDRTEVQATATGGAAGNGRAGAGCRDPRSESDAVVGGGGARRRPGAGGQVPGIKIMSGVEKIVIEPSDPELAGV